MPAALSPDLLEKMDAYWRATNYLTIGQIYLQDNPASPEYMRARRHHVKSRRTACHSHVLLFGTQAGRRARWRRPDRCP